MDNLKNLNFTELDPSEMKHVRGGNWLETLVEVLGIVAAADMLGITIEELRKRLGL